MTKMDDVLNTPELLELVLSKLPMRDLLLAQRVCKGFNTAIASSPTLQQALFFRPLPATAAPPPSSASVKLLHSPDDTPTTEAWERNPLLALAFWPWFDRSTPRSRFSAPFWDPETFETLPLAAETTRFAFLRSEASWRRMLVTQPPVAELNLMLVTHAMGGDDLDYASISPGNGVRMGLLYDVTCQELLGSRSRSMRSFRVQWHGADRKIVLSVRRTLHCYVKNYNNPLWNIYYSGACEGTSFEWRRDIELGTPGASSVPDDILLAGDYEVED
ncbi:f-box domain protein [Diplodia corticola]|uniref:F-box domain protein n=1 Tax=Diplodia corticola TaxID=236234 RepID=A0A1J9SLN6_9PEZI|nr:f-box domain protein [Diplodia corticola]OJD40525.1 f-box domain protein [Diplodia corticola]